MPWIGSSRRKGVMPMRLELQGSPSERVQHYCSRASELRVIAGEWTDSGVREPLLRVADIYEHMAELWKKQAQTGHTGGSPAKTALSAAA